MKFESLSPNKILIRNDDQHGEGELALREQNSLMPTQESMLVSDDKNEVDESLQMVRYSKIEKCNISDFSYNIKEFNPVRDM